MNKKANKPHKQNQEKKEDEREATLTEKEKNTAPREGVIWVCAVLRGRTEERKMKLK